MSNPLNDLVAVLTAATADFDPLGAARYVILVTLYALVAASLVLAVSNLRNDRAQRSGALLWIWLTRMILGGLVFRAMLGTLPFGTDNALHGWVSQMAGRAAFPQLSAFVSDVVLPHFGLVNPLVFLLEFGVAAGFVLGLFVRVAGLLTVLAGVALWLGLYGERPGDPAVWSWGFVLLALLGGLMVLLAAGRALGADAWIRRTVPSVRDRRPAGLLLRILT